MSINIVFQETTKPNVIIQAKPKMSVSELIHIYYKKVCASKKEKMTKKFEFQGSEISPDEGTLLSELGMKDYSSIQIRTTEAMTSAPYVPPKKPAPPKEEPKKQYSPPKEEPKEEPPEEVNQQEENNQEENNQEEENPQEEQPPAEEQEQPAEEEQPPEEQPVEEEQPAEEQPAEEPPAEEGGEDDWD